MSNSKLKSRSGRHTWLDPPENAEAGMSRGTLPAIRRTADGHVALTTVGDDEYGPWEVVIVNGSLPKIPRDILTQMSDGGRLLFFLRICNDYLHEIRVRNIVHNFKHLLI